MNANNGDYIHGTDPAEQSRLSLLNELMNDKSLRAMALGGGEKILDVGCGLGQFALSMARSVAPDGRVVGIDRDNTQLSEARRGARKVLEAIDIEYRQGDALDLTIRQDEWGTFDIVHSRFLLEHLPAPQAAVDAMVRAARPGGRIILEDDDHDVLRLWPEPEGVYNVWRAYIESYKKLGNDPYVGRRLVSLLHAAGAEPTRNSWNFFGSCAGNETFRGFVENFAGVVKGARDTILASATLESSAFDSAMKAFDDWGRRPDAALWYCTFWAEGRRPL
ncbi:MAG: methyltransferase domain-containing protein [Candidatus Krumholzibacteria bacterium]|nr:methyltransferase domain-containing protein [Candidatus Krumholzibacteria bacterium]